MRGGWVLRKWLVAIGLLGVLLSAGCSEDPAGEERAGPGGSAAEVSAEKLHRPTAVVEQRSVASEGMGSEDRFEVVGAAADGDVVLVAGHRDTADGVSTPVLARSTDGGATWTEVEVGLDADDRLLDVAHGGGRFLVAVSRGVNLRVATSADGRSFQAAQVQHSAETALTGVTLVAGDDAALALVEGEVGDASVLTISRSDDGGAAWSSVRLPGELATAPLGDRELRAADLAGSIVLHAVDGSSMPSIWQGEPAGAGDWSRVGAVSDVLGAEAAVGALVADGDELVVAADVAVAGSRDLAIWSGAPNALVRDDLPIHIAGGPGDQRAATAAVVDGAVVVAGRSVADAGPPQASGPIEVWARGDEGWTRALDQPALGRNATSAAVELVETDGGAVLVGLEERPATAEEHERAEADTAAPPPRFGQDVVAWHLALREAPASAPFTVEAWKDTSFSLPAGATAVELAGATSHDGRVYVVGSVVDGAGTTTPRVWVLADGSWSVHQPVLSDAPDSWFSLVEALADGTLVAGGWVLPADPEAEHEFRLWWSTDAETWSPATFDDGGADGRVYGVAETVDGLVAVGERFDLSAPYRDTAMWRSVDGGRSWAPAEVAPGTFDRSDVEVLLDVTVGADGELVAVGHAGTAEPREDGFNYRPVPTMFRSRDGFDWDRLALPDEEMYFGSADVVRFVDGQPIALGEAILGTDEQVDGHVAAFEPDAGALRIVPAAFRDRFGVEDALELEEGGLLVAGSISGFGSSVDRGIVGVLDDDGFATVGSDELVAGHPIEVVALEPLGDGWVAFGQQRFEDRTFAAVWRIARTPPD